MNIPAIIIQHRRICNLVVRNKVKQSFDIMSEMLDNVSFGGFRDEFEDLRMTYRNILKYTIEGVQDPGRQKVYLKLQQSILKLNDRIKQDILTHHSGWYTYTVRERETRDEQSGSGGIIHSIDDLVFKTELDEVLASANIQTTISGTEKAASRERLAESIFNHLWLTDYYGDAEKSLMSLIRKSGRFQWYEQASFVSALTLSSLRIWDPAKIFLLAEMYSDTTDHVSERALTGLIFSLYYYNDRVDLYPEVKKLISKLATGKSFAEHCRLVVLQAIRSRDTEKLTKRMHDEILPKVVKLRPRIEEKLDLDAILGDNPEEGGNPDWSGMFSGSDEIFKTMEELTNLQMEGSDVYMSAFSGLKNFDFFRKLRNWFIPFYPDHEAVDVIFHDEVLGPGINELAEALYKTPFICNSDKFSLVLNMKHLPAAQKSLMLKAFRIEMESLEQMKYDNELTDPGAVFRTTVTQYIHDLYRFYKLSDYRAEFDDLFSGKLDIYNSVIYRETCGSAECDISLADYFFSKEYYDDALSLYQNALSVINDDPQLLEKAGYCYQKAGKYEEALEKYSLASIINPKPWTLRKMGLCQRRLGRPSEALKDYLRALKADPEDLHTVLMTAHCYLDTGDYNKALKNYFHIEYNNPQNVKVLRPIAWCYLSTGKLKEAERYFTRLAEAGLTAHDKINMGHLSLCQGKAAAAAQYYISALESGEISAEAFINIYNDDSAMLRSNGVRADDLPIVLDYVLMNTRN